MSWIKCSDAELLQAYHDSLVSQGIPPPVSKSIRESSIGTKKSIGSFDTQTIQYGLNGQVIITSLKKPNYAIRLYVDVKVWRPFGWNLPSNGVAYDLCGHIWYDEGRGCLRVKEHPDGKIFVRLVGATCFRFECPKCYQKACAREAGRIEDKFKRLSKNNAEASVPGLGRPIHLVISVPEAKAYLMHDDYERLKAEVYAIAGSVGVYGGCSIFHPYANEKMHEEKPEKILIDKSTGDFDLESLKKYYAKMDKNINFWYVRPHFHLICYAPRDYNNPENDSLTPEKVKAVFEKTGYVVKNLGVRDSVRNTAHYQLSHCGVKTGKQTVTWFGVLSNRNYHKLNPLPKMKPTKPRCPVCDFDLEPVKYDPQSEAYFSKWIQVSGKYWIPEGLPCTYSGPSPLEGLPEGGYWIDPGGWRPLYDGEKLHSCLIRPRGHVEGGLSTPHRGIS